MQLPPTVLSLDEGRHMKAGGQTKSVAKTMEVKGKNRSKNVEATKSRSAAVAATVRSSSEDEGGMYGLSEDSDEDVERSQSNNNVAKSKPPKRKRATQFQRLIPSKTLEVTLFDRLEKMYGPSIKKMLKIQYR
jgi:DNA polymerase alpha-associated DNA helicase A